MAFSPAAREVPSLQEKEHVMVEVPPPPATASWQKSSASGDADGNCVQVAGTSEHVWLRDSKNPFGPALGLPRAQWMAFLAGIRRDDFGLPARRG